MRQPKLSRTIVWCLRSPVSQIRCVIQPSMAKVELLLLQNGDVAVRDVFDRPEVARERAHYLRQRFLARGWQQVFR